MLLFPLKRAAPQVLCIKIHYFEAFAKDNCIFQVSCHENQDIQCKLYQNVLLLDGFHGLKRSLSFEYSCAKIFYFIHKHFQALCFRKYKLHVSVFFQSEPGGAAPTIYATT